MSKPSRNAFAATVVMATIAAACAGEADFKASRSEPGDATRVADAGKAEDQVVVQPSPPEVIKGGTKIISKHDSTVTEIFELGKRESLTDLHMMPSSPFNEKACQQIPAPKTTFDFEVADRGERTTTFQKVPPIRHTDTLAGDRAQRRIDVFITLDNSESVTTAVKNRMKAAVAQLVSELYGYNLKLFLGGLEGTGGNYHKVVIDKGSKTLAQLQTDVANAIEAIRLSGALGDERVFRSLNRLARDHKSSDRDDAAKVYLALTDATNCTDVSNGFSNSCVAGADKDDHWSYLYLLNDIVPQYAKPKGIFGAYYRKTDNTAVCSNIDATEPGTAQYERAALQFEQAVYGGNPTASPWTGDICAVNEDLTWMQAFLNAAKEIADRRIILVSNSPDNFPADPGYNLTIKDQDGNVVGAANYDVEDGRLVKLKYTPTGSVSGVYHKLNNYDRLVYANILDPEPEIGSVRLSWPPNGATTCVEAANFDAQPADVKCRHSGKTLALRDLAFLPAVVPGGAAVTVTVKWYNIVPKVRQVTIDADTRVHLPSIEFPVRPAAAAALVNNATKTPAPGDATKVTLTFSDDLPPGQYRVAADEDRTYASECVLPALVIDGNAADIVACYLPPAKGRMVNEAVELDDEGSRYPCAFDRANNKVTYGGPIPVNVMDQRILRVGFLARQDPRDTFPLRYPPRGGVVKAYLGEASDDPGVKGDALADTEYQLDGNTVVLKQPLPPGMRVRFDYDFDTPIPECLELEGAPMKGQAYAVSYHRAGDKERPKRLMPGADYEIREVSGGPTLVCLARELLLPNAKVRVTYLADSTQDEKMEP